MTTRDVRRGIQLVLAYEPSWFAEVASAIGILFWGLFCFTTDDYVIHGTEWILPCIAVTFAPVRAWLLFRIWPGPRVLAAMLGFVFWGWVYFSLFRRFGSYPTEGPLIGLIVADLLTCGKFSYMVLERRRQGMSG
jgi:hypothetical protein